MIENESVERICKEIREDGSKEIGSILDKARRTAEEIVSRAEKKARETGDRIIRSAMERGDIEKRRILSSVSLEVRRIKLQAREEVVRAAMKQVEQAVASARSRNDYADILAKLSTEAIRSLEGNRFIVYADRRDVALIQSKVFPALRESMKAEGRTLESLEIEPLPAPILGGVQVGIRGGKVIFDNTFEARLYRFRDDCRSIIFSEVFSPQETL